MGMKLAASEPTGLQGPRTPASAAIQFMFMNQPPFDDLDQRRELLRRFNELPGVELPPDSITRRPRIPLSQLAADPNFAAGFEGVLDWFLDTAQARRV